MTQEIEQMKFRKRIPETHRKSLDTRLAWLWNQRFGTVQQVYSKTDDLLDRTAATLLLQCILAEDLESIKLLFYRLEGGAITDQDLLEKEQATLRV